MENISNIDTTPRIDSVDRDCLQGSTSASAVTPQVGILEGVKVVGLERSRDPSLLTDVSSRSSSLTQEESGSLHNFVQLSPSISPLDTESASSSGSSPSLSDEKLEGGEEILGKRAFLSQKIREAQQVVYSSSEAYSRELNSCQKQYVENLQRIFQEMNIFLRSDSHQEDAVKVGAVFDQLIQIADEIKAYNTDLIKDKIARKERPYNGVVGWMREALEHSFDYIKNLREGHEEKAAVDWCLVKKCFVKYKGIQAEEQGLNKQAALFASAFSCYEEALYEEAIEPQAHEEIGNAFYLAASLQPKEPKLTLLYKELADCLKKEVQLVAFKETTSVECSQQRAQYHYATLASDHMRNAISAFNEDKKELINLYKDSKECCNRIFKKLELPNTANEIELLDQALSYFATAIMNAEEHQAMKSSMNQLVGSCFLKEADCVAKMSEHTLQAVECLRKGRRALVEMLRPEQEQDKGEALLLDYQKASVSLATCYSAVADILMWQEEREVSFYLSAAHCYENILSNMDKRHLIFLWSRAGQYYVNAEVALSNKKQELANINKKIALALDEAAATEGEKSALWEELAFSYEGVMEEQNKGIEGSESALQLFQSAVMYHETIIQKIEREGDHAEDIFLSLAAAAKNLFLSAEAMQKGNRELSNAYENCAASHHHLAIAYDASLLQKFPSQFQRGFQSGAASDEGLIAYWKEVAATNHELINELLDQREDH